MGKKGKSNTNFSFYNAFRRKLKEHCENKTGHSCSREFLKQQWATFKSRPDYEYIRKNEKLLEKFDYDNIEFIEVSRPKTKPFVIEIPPREWFYLRDDIDSLYTVFNPDDILEFDMTYFWYLCETVGHIPNGGRIYDYGQQIISTTYKEFIFFWDEFYLLLASLLRHKFKTEKGVEIDFNKSPIVNFFQLKQHRTKDNVLITRFGFESEDADIEPEVIDDILQIIPEKTKPISKTEGISDDVELAKIQKDKDIELAKIQKDKEVELAKIQAKKDLIQSELQIFADKFAKSEISLAQYLDIRNVLMKDL